MRCFVRVAERALQDGTARTLAVLDKPLMKHKHVVPDFTALGVGRVPSSFCSVCGMD